MRPKYGAPSRFELVQHILKSEAARVQLSSMEEMKAREGLTSLYDGWEDAAVRSIHVTVAAEVGKPPIVLGLTNTTGQRATASAIIELYVANL